MFYRILSGDVVSTVLLCGLLYPPGYCAKIETDDRTSRTSFYVTRRPIPWNKITVPNLLSPELDSENSDYESFKTFVYVLFGITLVIGLYYFLKCCKCAKPLGAAIFGSSQSHPTRRLASPIQRTSRNRTARRMRRYQRINTPELHTTSSRSRTPLRTTDAETILIKSDKPPDYSTVVLSDQEASQEVYPTGRAETPPPSYDEHVFK